MTSMHVADPPVAIRPLAPADLDAVVAIDAASRGRTRRDYVERRLRAAQRDPHLHAQFAAMDADGLAGCILARVLAGEFGRSRPALRLELMGVRADRRGAGIGTRLFDTLQAWASRHGMAEIRTAADWHDTDILAWFDALGFDLAPEVVLERPVAAPKPAAEDDDASLEAPIGREIDYGRAESNDHERIERDLVEVRSMTPADLDAIVRIDRGITGRDRREYMGTRLAEAMDDAAIRVSLSARCDGALVGYLMARADLGDFGRTEPVAVIDTLGVDPEYGHRGVGSALLSRLFADLDALRVEGVETLIAQRDLDLLGFLYAGGFAPSQRLPFVHRAERRS